MDQPGLINKVLILGGGSAGFMAAIALKAKLPELMIVLLRSRDIGIIGVGEGSTVPLTKFLHEYLRIGIKKFHETAQPTWKLGLNFIWGPPERNRFFYALGPQTPATKIPELPRTLGHYCWDDADYDITSALMAADKAFERTPQNTPLFPNLAFAYHFENEKFVTFLESYARALGIDIVDDTVKHVARDESGITSLSLASGQTQTADLYVDASGFASLLLGKTLNEPFDSFSQTLLCDRAVVGGWDRTDEPIKPYTTCETMQSGWAWQIEHEHRINRGYVYSSHFISDDAARQEFLSHNPRITATRLVRFTSGAYRRAWVKNVFAVGNATGFVEPLEATALGVIAMQARLLADTLLDTARRPTPTQIAQYNAYHHLNWSAIRDFIAVHYKFNTRLNTPFWQTCRADVPLPPAAQSIVDYYTENGPSALWQPTLLHPLDQFGLGGYWALLVGQQVPWNTRAPLPQSELRLWNDRQRKLRSAAARGLSVKESLDIIRSSNWKWTTA